MDTRAATTPTFFVNTRLSQNFHLKTIKMSALENYYKYTSQVVFNNYKVLY